MFYSLFFSSSIKKPTSTPGGKEALERWNNFNIDDHDVEDVKTSNDIFSKFETSQIKSAIRRLGGNDGRLHEQSR